MTYQLTAPLLDACVLGIVDQEDSYGYTLTQKMQQVVDISESTLYPVLRRLQKSGHLRTYDAPFQGRNRRYYAITEEGRGLLDFYEKEWNVYKDKIDSLLGAGDAAETASAESDAEVTAETVLAEETAETAETAAAGESDGMEGESDE
ncbi:MAG: PadR family transcriptional regulator [Lachnospiraceae bacterium]|nr:PadR family transcriptional regulator [Lachnospiraceae bacterium]